MVISDRGVWMNDWIEPHKLLFNAQIALHSRSVWLHELNGRWGEPGPGPNRAGRQIGETGGHLSR
jgi:hypothetical protein